MSDSLSSAPLLLRRPWLLLWIALAFASAWIRLLPWRLEYNDLAKQAFVSVEMVTEGAWWVQRSPDGEMATKPPLCGWMSAGIYLLSGSWLLAWHLPSVLGMLAILFAYRRWLPPAPAAAAMVMLLWNHMSQSMIFVIRTDMVLAATIFLPVGLIATRLRDQQPLSGKDQGLLLLWITLGLYTKGPVNFAFLLPGVLLFFCRCRNRPASRLALPSPWIWPAALVLFLAWVGIAALKSPEFVEQVILGEFGSRFQSGESAEGRPPGYYTLHFLSRFAPWSLLFFAILLHRPTRQRLWQQPDTCWLLCILAGGWILMELIPSKRPDRFYPIFPVAAFLIARAWPQTPGATLRKTVNTVLLILVAANVSYSFNRWQRNTARGEGNFVTFGREAATRVAPEDLWIQKTAAWATGIVLHAGSTQIVDDEALVDRWLRGELPAVIVCEEGLARFEAAGISVTPALSTDNPRAARPQQFLLLADDRNEQTAEGWGW